MNAEGKRFKKMRLLLDLTQAEVADMLGINQGHVSTFERDKLTNAEARDRLKKFVMAVKTVVEVRINEEKQS